MLSQVERGIASPTIVSLVAIANSLSLLPAFFFEDSGPMQGNGESPVYKSENKKAALPGGAAVPAAGIQNSESRIQNSYSLS